MDKTKKIRDRFFMLKPGSVKLSGDDIFDRKIRSVENGLLKVLDYRGLGDYY